MVIWTHDVEECYDKVLSVATKCEQVPQKHDLLSRYQNMIGHQTFKVLKFNGMCVGQTLSPVTINHKIIWFKE